MKTVSSAQAPASARSCWTRHDASVQLAKLALRTRNGALRGGALGPALTTRVIVNRLWQKDFEAGIVRDSGRNLAVGSEPVFPFIPVDILVGQFRGKWENTPEALNGVKHEGER